MRKISINLISSSFIFMLSGLTSCNITTVAKANSAHPVLAGQKTIYGNPPTVLGLSAGQARGAFGYDFNRDGVTDWVVSTTQRSYEAWETHSLFIHLSQPNGTFRQVVNSNFDPSDGGDEPWGVSVKLTDCGDLLITSHNTSPFSSSDKRNSYRFRFVGSDFVLQEYTHGYSGHSYGKYRVSYIFDLANRIYRKSDTERCDNEPQKPCPSAVSKHLGNVPTMTFGNFGGHAKVDLVADLEKYVAK